MERPLQRSSDLPMGEGHGLSENAGARAQAVERAHSYRSEQSMTHAQIPFVIEKEGRGERAYDIYSRLLKDRIIFMAEEVNSDEMKSVTAQLLFLANEDRKLPIRMYLNSPG